MTTKIIIWKEEHSIISDTTKNFLDNAENNGISIPSSCRVWYCMVCACKIKKWKEFINRNLTWDDLINDPESDIILSCVAWPTSDTEEIILETL